MNFFERLFIEIKNFPRNIKRSFKWFFRMYHSYEWSYDTIYETLYYKIQDAERHIYEHKNHTRYKRDCLIMRCALRHLDYIINDYKCVEELFELHEKKFGRSELNLVPYKEGMWEWKGNIYSKCNTPEETEYAEKIHRKINKIWMERRKYHKRRFHYIFETYIEYWWD